MTEPQLPAFVQTSNSELRVSKFAKHSCSTPQRTVSTVHPQSVVSRRLRRLEQSNVVLDEADGKPQESPVLFPSEVGAESSEPIIELANNDGDHTVHNAPSDAGQSIQERQHSIQCISESVRKSSMDAALMLNDHCRLSNQATGRGVLGLRIHVRVESVLNHMLCAHLYVNFYICSR